MFSFMQKRFGIPGVIAVIALVFAMAGGALAAKKYVITSTSQIKPNVLTQLKGAKGAKGAAGAKGDTGAQGAKGDAGSAGAQGPAGAKGATGPAGAAGTPGVRGPTGDKGATGDAGPTGPEGSPWTVGGVLPPGKTETGAWTMGTIAAGAVPESFFLEPISSPISFMLPLPAAIGEANVHYMAEGAPAATGCTGGSAAAPKADPGHLCVYTTTEDNAEGKFLFLALVNANEGGPGAGTTGARLDFGILKKGARASGSWAVTAPATP